jgi:hypothetical protein
VYLRPDAYLYSQSYLMSLGMAVTWDNPDVTLTDMGGVITGSHDLLPSTRYRITATIHNRSAKAPAPGLPVVFTLISFGAGGALRQHIGMKRIDLPVRAAPGEPAAAVVEWDTPPTPGHYCIEIEAVWPDDDFPPDNVGQHNTVIRRARAGERLRLRVPLTNNTTQLADYQLRVDGYQLPAHPFVRRGEGQQGSRQQHIARVAEANHPSRFPAAEGWDARLSTAELRLEPGGEAVVDFEATVPAGTPAGNETRFNIAVAGGRGTPPAGGVTVIVQVI